MLDGAELGAALATHPGNVETALAAYEARMFERSQLAAEDAHRILALLHDDRAPFSLVDFFAGARERAREDAAQS